MATKFIYVGSYDIDTNVSEWYQDLYPADELGREIDKDITFRAIFSALDNNADVYDTLGVEDSIVRERVFGGLATAMNVSYNVVYNRWLHKDTKVITFSDTIVE